MRAETARKMNAYRVPAVSVIGLANVKSSDRRRAVVESKQRGRGEVCAGRDRRGPGGVPDRQGDVGVRTTARRAEQLDVHALQLAGDGRREGLASPGGVVEAEASGTDGAVLRFRVVRVRQLNAAWVRDEVTVGRNPALEGALRVVGEAAALCRGAKREVPRRGATVRNRDEMLSIESFGHRIDGLEGSG